MNFGKIAAGGLVAMGLGAGIAVWWLQEYAFYQAAAFPAGQEITLAPITGGAPEVIAVEAIEGIDADSSPLRFRACFTTALSPDMLSQSYARYESPTPLNGPNWFDCYDAAKIGTALESGEAFAFLSQHEIHPDVDRVVAVFHDGRAFAWHQLNKVEE